MPFLSFHLIYLRRIVQATRFASPTQSLSHCFNSLFILRLRIALHRIDVQSLPRLRAYDTHVSPATPFVTRSTQQRPALGRGAPVARHAPTSFSLSPQDGRKVALLKSAPRCPAHRYFTWPYNNQLPSQHLSSRHSDTTFDLDIQGLAKSKARSGSSSASDAAAQRRPSSAGSVHAIAPDS